MGSLDPGTLGRGKKMGAGCGCSVRLRDIHGGI